MTHARPVRPLLAALLAALSACSAGAASSAREEALLSDTPRPRDRVCRVAWYPRDLPSADALVDSAALVRAAAAAWNDAGRPGGYALFGLRYDRYGLQVRREVIEHDLPAALADTLRALSFAHRRTAGEAEQEWGVRLRLDLGESPRLRVGRSEVCEAALRDRGGGMFSVTGAWGDVRDARPAPTAVDAGTVWLRVAVDAAGNVVQVRVERGAGRYATDSRLLAAVRALDFLPATEDGHPVPGETSIPVRVR